MTTGSTEERLRETLDALAAQVDAAPPAYEPAHAQWRRRERRRRLILAVLIAIVFAVADLIGLWALNQTQDRTPIIFDDRTRIHEPATPSGINPP
jgi:type VI protein secretion system component VasF